MYEGLSIFINSMIGIKRWILKKLKLTHKSLT